MTRVYRDFDQSSLDFQYDNRAQVPDPKRYLDWYPETSARIRERVRHVSALSYGPLPAQLLDIYLPDDASPSDRRPIVVYVHGGAWRALGRPESGFAAETFTRRGAVFVALGFSIMPAAGDLDEMVAEVRAGIAWIHANLAGHGGDPDRLHVIGHSSGGHLAAMVAVTDWPRLYGLPADTVRSAAVVSGMYDLEPVRLSKRNALLKLDRAAEVRNSPCRNLPSEGPPLLVANGEQETAEFRRQAQDFAALWRRRFGNADSLEVAGKNHYEVIETLTEPNSPLVLALDRHFGL